jgi:hypothetical protein
MNKAQMLRLLQEYPLDSDEFEWKWFGTPKNTADAVLRPAKGGLRCSVTHKFAFLVQTGPTISGRSGIRSRQLLL